MIKTAVVKKTLSKQSDTPPGNVRPVLNYKDQKMFTLYFKEMLKQEQLPLVGKATSVGSLIGWVRYTTRMAKTTEHCIEFASEKADVLDATTLPAVCGARTLIHRQATPYRDLRGTCLLFLYVVQTSTPPETSCFQTHSTDCVYVRKDYTSCGFPLLLRFPPPSDYTQAHH